jgi:dienelactone hydrolase
VLVSAPVGARLVWVVASLAFAACGPGGGPPSSPSSVATPAAASLQAVTPFSGSYSTDDGDIVVIARMGWYFDLRDATYRTIYATASPNRFTIGPGFEEPLPRVADLVFGQEQLTVRESGRTRSARRITYRQTDVMVPSAGANLAATITEPVTAGPHPGIVVVHGAERGERYIYDVWVGIYASLGLDVLTYDKRGIGASTGTYPGEFPTSEALSIYADDAEAAREFLSRWPGVDGQRTGFHGGSQGGWTVPLAMSLHPGARFAVLVSAPATTVDQADLWAGFSGNGAAMPAESTEQMLAAVRATHSGFDPSPALSAITAPVLWVLGTNDRTVPTAVSIEIIDSLHKPNFTVQQVATGHGLLVNPTGLNADDARSAGLAPQLVPTLRGWLGKVLAF